MLVIYEADVNCLLVGLDAIVRQLEVRGKIPAEAQVQPLDSSHVPAVLDLHAEFPCPPATALLRLLGTANEGNYCRERSVVLTIGGAVAGAFLVQAEPSPAAAFIYGVVVARDWRRSWATAVLKYYALRVLQNLGTEVVRFHASSNDTRRHAARAAARPFA